MRSLIALIPAAVLLLAAGDASAQSRPVHVDRGPVHVDRSPVHVDRGPVYVDRGPIHVQSGPVHVVAPPVRYVAPVHTVIVDSWDRIDQAWTEIAWLREEVDDLDRAARVADASYAERLVDDADNALDEAESVLTWRGSRSVYDAQIAQARASLAAAGYELDAMRGEVSDARSRAGYLIDEAEDAACDARVPRCTSVVDDAQELLLIGRSEEEDGQYGDALDHFEDAAAIAQNILSRIDDRRDYDPWDNGGSHDDEHGHDDCGDHGHDSHPYGDEGHHYGDDRHDDDWSGYFPGSTRHSGHSM